MPPLQLASICDDAALLLFVLIALHDELLLFKLLLLFTFNLRLFSFLLFCWCDWFILLAPPVTPQLLLFIDEDWDWFEDVSISLFIDVMAVVAAATDDDSLLLLLLASAEATIEAEAELEPVPELELDTGVAIAFASSPSDSSSLICSMGFPTDADEAVVAKLLFEFDLLVDNKG